MSTNEDPKPTSLEQQCAKRKEKKKKKQKVKSTGNPLGRPKKAPKKAVGRPKGEAGIMKEYRERMLNSPRSVKVLDSIFEAALDDNHKNQAAAWKLVMDRIVPVSGFDKAAQGTSRSAITVNISGVPGVSIGSPDDPQSALEGQFEQVVEE